MYRFAFFFSSMLVQAMAQLTVLALLETIHICLRRCCFIRMFFCPVSLRFYSETKCWVIRGSRLRGSHAKCSYVRTYIDSTTDKMSYAVHWRWHWPNTIRGIGEWESIGNHLYFVVCRLFWNWFYFCVFALLPIARCLCVFVVASVAISFLWNAV